MDGQRVEHLVAEDGTDDGFGDRRGSGQDVRPPRVRQSRGDRLDAAGLDLDRVVRDRPFEPRPVAPEAVEDRDRQGPVAGAVLAHDEPWRLAEPTPRLVEDAGDRPAEDRVRLGGRDEVAGPAGPCLRPAVVAARRVVQREVHEPDEGHRAAGRISSRIRATSASSSPTASRSGAGSRRRPGVSSMAHPAGSPCAPDHEPDTRPDERVPAQQDRDRCGRSRRGQGPQPRIRDPVGQQQVGREPVLGPRPARLVGAEPMGQQDPGVDERRVAEAREMLPERVRPVALEKRPEHGCSRALARDAGPHAPLLDEGPRPRCRPPLEPSDGRGRRPPGDEELRRWVGRDTTDRRRALRDGAEVDGAAAASPAVWPPPVRTTSSGPSMSTASRHRRRRSPTAYPATSSSQRGSALSPARSGTSASVSPARAIATTSAE